MTNSNLRINTGLASVSTSTAKGSVIGPGGWAKSWGRQSPRQSNGGICIGEVVQDLFSADEIGIAFPAGTLWVRVQSRYSGGTGPDGYDDDSFYWVAVPATLPAGYTYNPNRNPIGLTYAVGGLTSAGIGSGQVNFLPVYSPSLFVRAPTGVFAPVGALVDDVGTQVPWGPFNFNQTASFYDVGFASTVLDTFDTWNHPGYRNVRIEVKWVASFYTNPLTDPAYIEVVIDGVSWTSHKADASLTADGFYTHELDTGPSTQSAAGAFRKLHVTNQVLGSPFPGRGGIRSSFFFSPRVDIPLPFSATYGNLHAPGGVITGQIPGF